MQKSEIFPIFIFVKFESPERRKIIYSSCLGGKITKFLMKEVEKILLSFMSEFFYDQFINSDFGKFMKTLSL